MSPRALSGLPRHKLGAASRRGYCPNSTSHRAKGHQSLQFRVAHVPVNYWYPSSYYWMPEPHILIFPTDKITLPPAFKRKEPWSWDRCAGRGTAPWCDQLTKHSWWSIERDWGLDADPEPSACEPQTESSLAVFPCCLCRLPHGSFWKTVLVFVFRFPVCADFLF